MIKAGAGITMSHGANRVIIAKSDVGVLPCNVISSQVEGHGQGRPTP